MKINKKILKEMIRDALNEVTDSAEEDPTKLKTGSMSTGARIKGARERITSGSQEFSNQERNMIDQVEKYFSDVASTPGVDLMKHRALITRVLKMLQQRIGTAGAEETDTGEAL